MVAPKKKPVRLNPNTGKNQKYTEGYKKKNTVKDNLKSQWKHNVTDLKKNVKKSNEMWKSRGKKK